MNNNNKYYYHFTLVAIHTLAVTNLCSPHHRDNGRWAHTHTNMFSWSIFKLNNFIHKHFKFLAKSKRNKRNTIHYEAKNKSQRKFLQLITGPPSHSHLKVKHNRCFAERKNCAELGDCSHKFALSIKQSSVWAVPPPSSSRPHPTPNINQ